jgi:hypothetical protein
MADTKIGRVCVGGPLDGEIVEHETLTTYFRSDRLPSEEWPRNDNGGSLRRDEYVEDGPHWVWAPDPVE